MKNIEKLFSSTILVFLLLLSFYSLFYKDQIYISKVENRHYSTNEILNEYHVWDSEYRTSVENILVDQALLRYKFVEYKKELDYQYGQFIYQFIENPLLLKRVGDTNVYQIGNNPYLTTLPIPYIPEYEERIINRIIQINTIANDFPETDFYVYKPTQMLETTLLDDANGTKSYGPYYNSLLESQLEVPYTSLSITTFDDYLDFLYYSDHHWTHKGVYQGYLDIINLMLGDTLESLKITGENCFNGLTFNGTTVSITGFVTEGAPFCVYSYDYPQYELYYEGNLINEQHDTNQFYNSEVTDHFDYHYNDAYELLPYPQSLTMIELKSSIKNNENILIIGDSYAPPLLPLLTQHFSDIYFVNPLNYLQKYGEPFVYDNFLEENNIDNVLFLYIIENYCVSDEYWDRYTAYDVVRK